jgi:hypothetical protein
MKTTRGPLFFEELIYAFENRAGAGSASGGKDPNGSSVY